MKCAYTEVINSWHRRFPTGDILLRSGDMAYTRSSREVVPVLNRAKIGRFETPIHFYPFFLNLDLV